MGFHAPLTSAPSAGVHFEDEEILSFGNTDASPNVSVLWETADANANALLLAMPEGDGTDVPVFVIGDANSINADLGFFNGITTPAVAVLSDDILSYVYMAHNQTDAIFRTNEGVFDFNGGLDISAGLTWDTGVALTAAAYQIIRNADATNLLAINVPTGSAIHFFINGSITAAIDVTRISSRGLGEITSAANALITLATTGMTIARNIADANIAVILDQVHASSTGDIAEFRAASSPVLSIDRGGGVIFDVDSTVIAANHEVRRIAAGLNLNVPTGDTHLLTINGVTAVAISSTNLTLGVNIAFAADATYDIGTTTVGVNDIHLGLAGVVNFDGGDVTITHAANLLTIAGGDLTLTNSAITSNKSSAGAVLQANITATAYTTGQGIIDLFRTGALTGVGTETITDFNESPSFTLTQPAADSVTYIGVNVDLGSVAVTAGAGDSDIYALRLNACSDADSKSNLALLVDSGKVTLGGGGTNRQGSAFGGLLQMSASTITGNNASGTLAIGAAVSLGVTTLANGTATLTYTDMASLYIAGIPVASTNVAFTNTALALWVDAGLTRLDGGVSFDPAGQSTLSNYTEGTFTPTVALVGGAGNTTPVYVTNTGRYTRIGNRVFVDVYLTGDGGAEGAGTGTFSVALPVTASASNPTSYFPCGFFANGTAEDPIWGQIAGSGVAIDFAYEDVLNNFTVMTGAEQNNVTRTVRLKFQYEV